MAEAVSGTVSAETREPASPGGRRWLLRRDLAVICAFVMAALLLINVSSVSMPSSGTSALSAADSPLSHQPADQSGSDAGRHCHQQAQCMSPAVVPSAGVRLDETKGPDRLPIAADGRNSQTTGPPSPPPKLSRYA